ncbi:Fic family protein [Paracandidimonas lactea]|uniref:Fic family protein n=1 Tax=Paracandidimonas lactea TaxID=2895524 RepID=UPI001F3C2F06|nr:Fic family protein [Paracandidimonas lactea]
MDDMIKDDGEHTGLFEPLMIAQGSPRRIPLNELALSLAEKSAALRSALPPSIASSLSDLVRSMNCYYSNLIEGHNTHPIDIERALAGDYSQNAKKRNLQLEAKAHIAVQKWIDEGGMTLPATSPEMLLEMHRRFCELLPDDQLFVENPKTSERLANVPGQLRTRYVEVGRRVPISPGSVPRLLACLHAAFQGTDRVTAILAAACAHHRLLWIHPFLDGNGRVARLMSYAMLRSTLDTRGLWSVARGLARAEQAYKSHLQACDGSRRSDLDGRGNLSEAALAAFTEFFLQTCMDQVDFMAALMAPDRLHDHVMLWTREQISAGILPVRSDVIMAALLYRGELTRREANEALGMSERASRRITSALLQANVIKSNSPRAPLHLALSARYAERWMPGLFPAAPMA